jgi:hypothetical protein
MKRISSHNCLKSRNIIKNYHIYSLCSLYSEMTWYQILSNVNNSIVILAQIEALTRYPSQAHAQIHEVKEVLQTTRAIWVPYDEAVNACCEICWKSFTDFKITIIRKTNFYNFFCFQRMAVAQAFFNHVAREDIGITVANTLLVDRNLTLTVLWNCILNKFTNLDFIRHYNIRHNLGTIQCADTEWLITRDFYCFILLHLLISTKKTDNL